MSNPITVDFDAIGFSDLFVNYLAGKKNIGARFPGNPFDLDSSLKVADAAAKRSYPREELVRRLVITTRSWAPEKPRFTTLIF